MISRLFHSFDSHRSGSHCRPFGTLLAPFAPLGTLLAPFGSPLVPLMRRFPHPAPVETVEQSRNHRSAPFSALQAPVCQKQTTFQHTIFDIIPGFVSTTNLHVFASPLPPRTNEHRQKQIDESSNTQRNRQTSKQTNSTTQHNTTQHNTTQHRQATHTHIGNLEDNHPLLMPVVGTKPICNLALTCHGPSVPLSCGSPYCCFPCLSINRQTKHA